MKDYSIYKGLLNFRITSDIPVMRQSAVFISIIKFFTNADFILQAICSL